MEAGNEEKVTSSEPDRRNLKFRGMSKPSNTRHPPRLEGVDHRTSKHDSTKPFIYGCFCFDLQLREKETPRNFDSFIVLFAREPTQPW